MIREVIAPGLFNPSHTCYINAFVQVLFHIIPLKLMILAWPNADQTVSKVRLLFASMSQHHVIDAVSLSTICEPDFHDAKDCSEFALKILGANRDSSSGTLRSTIEHSVCFKLTTRFRARFSFRLVTNPPSFLLHRPVFGSSTLIDCLDSFFGIILLNSQSTETQQHFISFFPRFLFIHLGRDVWNRDHIEKDCRTIAFPVILDMTHYAFRSPTPSHYQLVSVITHLGEPGDYQGQSITFLRVFGKWVPFDDTHVQEVPESATLEENLPEVEDSTQTASILLYVSDN
jgi:ubiquitin C-terminal hydrolase